MNSVGDHMRKARDSYSVAYGLMLFGARTAFDICEAYFFIYNLKALIMS